MTITVSVESFPLRVVIQNPKTGRTSEALFGITEKGEVIMDGDRGGVRAVNPAAFRELNAVKKQP